MLTLLAWRGVLVAIALYAVLEKPFWTWVITVACLGALLLLGESVYASLVYWEEERVRKEKDREFRERRAEEARQRFAAMQKVEGAGRRGFGLDDEEPAPPPEATGNAASRLSSQDFDTALLDADAGR